MIVHECTETLLHDVTKPHDGGFYMRDYVCMSLFRASRGGRYDPGIEEQNGEVLRLLEAAAEAGEHRVRLPLVCRHGEARRHNGEKYFNTDVVARKKALDNSAQLKQNLAVDTWLAQHPGVGLFVVKDNRQYTYFPNAENICSWAE